MTEIILTIMYHDHVVKGIFTSFMYINIFDYLYIYMCVNILLLDDLDEPPGCCTNLHVPSIEHHNAWPRCQELARILRGPAGLERCLDAGNGLRI